MKHLGFGAAGEDARLTAAVTAAYCAGVPVASQVVGLPSVAERITPDWSAQNAWWP